MHTKRKRGQFTSSTFRRHRQTPILLKRANVHAKRRERSTSVLAIFLEIWRISETRIKSGRSMSYVLLLLSQPIGTYGFIGLHIIFYFLNILCDFILQRRQIIGIGIPNQGCICCDISMDQCIAHINNIAPRHNRMTLTKFFCQQIGCFTDNHDVINHCMKAHDVGPQIFKRLTPKEVIDMLNAFIDMTKTVYVSNCLSHK